MSPDGNTFALATNRGCARVFDRKTGREIRVIGVESTGVMDLAYSPDSQRLVVASGYPHSYVEMIDLATGESRGRLANGGVVRSVAWSPDSKWIATGKNGSEISLWSVHAGRVRRSFRANPRGTSALAFLPNGHLVSASFSGRVTEWEGMSRSER